ncbi:unnamed protein product [Phytophthora fragariaefolia]|uniref:Unnamed protein product n=1 Tax=Phytophthora fragariaefolia TaxID=1490495 RepID=A0A9W6U5K0_9STRA|nr:unnamed protein product [Phytophthora fragariaefolia]
MIVSTDWAFFILGHPLQHQSDGYLVIIQPKKVEVAEIQESLLSKDEYKQFRAISQSSASLTKNPTDENSTESVSIKEGAKPIPVNEEANHDPVPMEE